MNSSSIKKYCSLDPITFETLIKTKKLDPNYTAYGNTLMDRCIFTTDLTLAKILIENGFKKTNQIAIAITYGKKKMVKFLLENEFDPVYPLGESAPINIALNSNNKEVTDLLIKNHYQRITSNRPDPFWIAFDSSNCTMCEHLVKKTNIYEKKLGSSLARMRVSYKNPFGLGDKDTVKILRDELERRNKILNLLLCARDKSEESPFWKEVFPLDMMKLLLYFCNCKYFYLDYEEYPIDKGIHWFSFKKKKNGTKRFKIDFSK